MAKKNRLTCEFIKDNGTRCKQTIGLIDGLCKSHRKKRTGKPPAPKQTKKPADKARKEFKWPKNKAIPKIYDRKLFPCPECRRTRLDNGTQAVKCTSKTKDWIWLECRSCHHKFDLPLSDAKPKHIFDPDPECVYCKKRNSKQDQTRGHIQYRKCNSCKKTFRNLALRGEEVHRMKYLAELRELLCDHFESSTGEHTGKHIDVYYKSYDDMIDDICLEIQSYETGLLKRMSKAITNTKDVWASAGMASVIRKVLVAKARHTIMEEKKKEQ